MTSEVNNAVILLALGKDILGPPGAQLGSALYDLDAVFTISRSTTKRERVRHIHGAGLRQALSWPLLHRVLWPMKRTV